MPLTPKREYMNRAHNESRRKWRNEWIARVVRSAIAALLIGIIIYLSIQIGAELQ